MKITVLTLHIPDEETHLVAVVEGQISTEDFMKLADDLHATPATIFRPSLRQLFRKEMDAYPTAKAVKSVHALY